MSEPTASIEVGSVEPQVDMGSADPPNDKVSAATAAAPVYIGVVRTSNMAIASMVCGIVALGWGGIVLGPVAIVFGMYAIKNMDEKPGEFEGRPMAKAGIICGIIATVISILVFIVVLSTQL